MDNKHDVSCIPLGEFSMKRTLWEEKKAKYFLLQNVPGDRTGVFIHKGNFWENSKGCIILGMSFGFVVNPNGAMEFGVKDSAAAFNYFMDVVMAGIEEAKLIIQEA